MPREHEIKKLHKTATLDTYFRKYVSSLRSKEHSTWTVTSHVSYYIITTILYTLGKPFFSGIQLYVPCIKREATVKIIVNRI